MLILLIQKTLKNLLMIETRAIYAETLPNPYLRVFPIKEVADIGRKYNIPLIMDNTASPVICKPIEHGAAVVVHSLTKYIWWSWYCYWRMFS